MQHEFITLENVRMRHVIVMCDFFPLILESVLYGKGEVEEKVQLSFLSRSQDIFP